MTTGCPPVFCAEGKAWLACLHVNMMHQNYTNGLMFKWEMLVYDNFSDRKSPEENPGKDFKFGTLTTKYWMFLKVLSECGI